MDGPVTFFACLTSLGDHTPRTVHSAFHSETCSRIWRLNVKSTVVYPGLFSGYSSKE